MSEIDSSIAQHRGAKDLLEEARRELEQESNRIQIQGRALTDTELRRVQRIGRVVDLINQALGELGGDEDTESW